MSLKKFKKVYNQIAQKYFWEIFFVMALLLSIELSFSLHYTYKINSVLELLDFLSDKLKTEPIELIKTAGYFVGGGFIILQIRSANRRAEAMEKQVKSSNKNNKIAEKGQVQQRFRDAIDQLGSAEEPVRLGGIYSLHHLAKDSKEYVNSVFEILCSYIREKTTQTNYKRESPSIEIQAIIDLLFREKSERIVYSGLKPNLLKANLCGADIENAQFINGDLMYVDFSNCNASKANFTGSNISLSNFEKAFLYDCILNCQDTFQVKFNNTIFDRVALSKNVFVKCDFSNAEFRDSDFYGAYFGGCKIEETKFKNIKSNNILFEDTLITKEQLKALRLNHS